VCYDLIDLKKVATMTSLPFRAVNQNWIHSEWVSNDSWWIWTR